MAETPDEPDGADEDLSRVPTFDLLLGAKESAGGGRPNHRQQR